MNNEEIKIILQSCLFALEGDDIEEVVKFSDFRPELIGFAFKLTDYLKEKEIGRVCRV